MNIGEAVAFQKLMDSVVIDGDKADEAVEAAALLAHRARKALGAGPTADEIRARYAEVEAS